jgi:hypothetical protein
VPHKIIVSQGLLVKAGYVKRLQCTKEFQMYSAVLAFRDDETTLSLSTYFHIFHTNRQHLYQFSLQYPSVTFDYALRASHNFIRHFRSLFPSRAITVDCHSHLTHAYRLLSLLARSASDKPCVPIIAPHLSTVFHIAECLADVITHRITYTNLHKGPDWLEKGIVALARLLV